MLDYSAIMERRQVIALEKKKNTMSASERALISKEEDEEFMEIARRIAGLIKEIGSLPTPRQLKIHLGIDARDMRKICGQVRIDPYELFVKEARKILLKEEGLIVGFGRMEKAPETEDTPS